MANRSRMSTADRAKQFMPFSALKGFKEAIAEREKVVVDKIELSEEAGEKLDYKMHQIKKRDIVTVVYFKDDEYLKITGMVSRFDITARVITIVNTKISFDDIYDISGELINND